MFVRDFVGLVGQYWLVGQLLRNEKEEPEGESSKGSQPMRDFREVERALLAGGEKRPV